MALKHFGSLDDLPKYTHELWIEYQNAVTKQCEDAGIKRELLCVEAGDTVIWHPQLPHGGGPIGDITKSRFSFVMHTTPIGVPVYHQDVFFNPNGNMPMDASWEYRKVNGKYMVDQGAVDFAHQQAFEIQSFKQISGDGSYITAAATEGC